MDRSADQTTTFPTESTGRRRHVAFAALAALLALGAGVVAVAATGGGGDHPTSASVTPTTAVLDPEVVLVDAPAPAPSGSSVTPAGPAVQPPAEQPTAEQPPAEEPPAEEPPAPAADPGVLDVNKKLIHMAANDWSGKFQISNEGDSALDWVWTPGAPGIAVSQASGTLQPGEFVEIVFSIDHTVLPEGDFDFPNTVSSGDQVKNVHIDGTKTIAKNPGVQLPDLDLGPND